MVIPSTAASGNGWMTDMAMKKSTDLVEMDPPILHCGNCRFTSALEGVWDFYAGRMVFVCAPDPQPRRGPDFSSCGECGARFNRASYDWGKIMLEDDVLAAVQKAALAARDAEWEEWLESDER